MAKLDEETNEPSEAPIEEKSKSITKATKKKEEPTTPDPKKQIMIDMAVKMITMGMEDEQIRELTGLSIKDIKALRKKLK